LRIQLKFQSSINENSSPDITLTRPAGTRLTADDIHKRLNAQLSAIAGGSDGVWEFLNVVLLNRPSKRAAAPEE